MKRILILCAAALSITACTPEQIAQDEAYVLAMVKAARAGVRIAAADAANAVNIVCGYMPAVVGDVSSFRSAIGAVGLIPGIKTAAALAAADAAVNAANDLCSTRTPGIASADRVKAAWAAYANAKAALAAAKQAAGK